MKILSMTATFGKLAHQTLTLQPGLNVIHAPNEWGKSTWCAFIVAMLYGIDTKERTTTASLADKEHYAPWSGAPMSGSMDIQWNDRNITLERTTKGRTPFGEFRAYETQSGLPVPELTASNCGEMLLGIEKSVFTRSGFVRLSDMPVVQDETLRRRLNALVTTGDESGTGDALAQRLRDLRNKCRHNKTGLLPQAESARNTLEDKLAQHAGLQAQLEQIRNTQQALETEKAGLENHLQVLEYTASQNGIQRLEQAQADAQELQSKYAQLHARCQMLPSEEFATQQLQQLRSLQAQQAAMDAEVLPTIPVQPEAPTIFSGVAPAEALRLAQEDKARFDALSKSPSPVFLILAAVFAAAGIGLLFVQWYLLIPALLLGGWMFLLHVSGKKRQSHERKTIAARYGALDPAQWIPLAQKYSDEMRIFSEQEASSKAVSDSLEQRRQALRNNIHNATQGLTLEESIQKWERVIAEHKSLVSVGNDLSQAENRVTDLSATYKVTAPPSLPDTLTLSQEETTRAIASAAIQLQQLQKQEGQCLGQKEALGAEAALTQQLASVNARIGHLEDAYSALSIALDTLATATNELQRRFAPRIASRAQAMFETMTGGRYDRLQLTQDLGLNVAAEGEDSLISARWRSDGTVDQLYLALRLAVAAELTPDAPLVLDDALVRFDDTRHGAAMELLKTESLSRQVIVFTCQSREEAYAADSGINI